MTMKRFGPIFVLALGVLIFPSVAHPQEEDAPISGRAGGKTAVLDPEKGSVTLRFIERTSGVDRPLEGTLYFYGGPIIVEATFEDEQEEDAIEVVIESGAAQMTMTARAIGHDLKVFRTDEFYVTLEAEDIEP
jgi:hypothetical protein